MLSYSQRKIDRLVNIFERMIVLNKKTLKTVAAATVLTLGLSVMPAPAYAVSTNIVAETKDVKTLTVSQIQDLAAIYNDTKQSLLLKQKQLELQAQMLRNDRRTIENQINSMGSSGSADAGAGLMAMEQTIAGLKKAVAENPENMALTSQLAALTMQYESAKATQNSMAAQMQSSLDSALAGIEQLNDALDDLDQGKDDLNKAMKDLEKQMRYSAAMLSLEVIKLDKQNEVLEGQAALLERSVQIAELQQKLGMNIATDVSSAQASLAELEKSMVDLKDAQDGMKRSINIMIGRSANSELEIVPMSLPIAIESAPAYTPQLVSKFIDINGALDTLERDRVDLKDSVKDNMGSDEKQQIDYDVMAKDMEIDTKRQDIQDELKTLLAKINSNAAAYKVSRQKYVTEQKNFEFAQKKYELGMISELALRQAEAALKQAEYTNIQNGYQYYIDWQKYYLKEKGIEV